MASMIKFQMRSIPLRRRELVLRGVGSKVIMGRSHFSSWTQSNQAKAARQQPEVVVAEPTEKVPFTSADVAPNLEQPLPASHPSTSTTTPQSDDTPFTHFGSQSIPEALKETMVGKVFSSVAGKYDVMNDCMSLGVHRLWKNHFISTMAPGPGTKLLDVAGGTGDIALRFLEFCKTVHQDSSAHVKVVDINPSMLAHGAQRYQQSEFLRHGQAEFQVGNAENLEGVPDNSVDVYTISFGIRNCTHVDRVLKEAYRVLKPGGRFMCLEFSKVEAPVVKQLYDLYSFQIIPQIGSIVTNDRDSYQYLVESIRQFPDQVTFAQMIRDAGFVTVGSGFENLTFGVAAIHTGYKF